MADIYFYGDDDVEDAEGGDSDSSTNPDDLLPPIQKLERYASSENIFNRQVVARTILETLRAVVDEKDDVEAVLNVMNRLADDQEPSVRAELMEQVPHIAMYCCQEASKEHLTQVVPEHLLPMVVKFLTDGNNQVRKTSQAALLVLLEQGLVERMDVKEQVCPVITKLTEADSQDDFRTEAVALLSKMAPLIGKDMVEELFLERFATLCVDPLFHVRKVCAANFGDFSSVVGSEPTETVLLPKFFYLCEDGVWGVRKACADVFMPVSCVCSPGVRHSELSPLFINLLKDQSRWVRMAAFQALGPFISTFADPSITALLHEDNGEIVITDRLKLAQRLEELDLERAESMASQKAQQAPLHEEPAVIVQVPTAVEGSECAMDVSVEAAAQSESQPQRLVSQIQDDLSPEERRAMNYLADDDVNHFNSFNYWREPVLPLDGDKSSLNVEAADEIKDEAVDQLSRAVEEADITGDEDATAEGIGDDASTMELFRPASVGSTPGGGNTSQSSSTFDPRWDTFGGSSGLGGREYPPDPALPRGPPATEQDIVPQLLIDHYVSMIDPSRAQTVDTEIARHCAYSVPAVAITLGRANWPLLKDTYDALATDMQWKVRRTLASSIHELGVILGEEVASADLIPIFNGFLKDLDEVRAGLLKHLADFLKLLNTEYRRSYLPKLSEFLKMDNERNWRFRLELTEQLESLIPLYTASDIAEFIAPMAMVLVHDKVAVVRLCAINVIAAILKSLRCSDSPDLAESYLRCAVESLAKERLWFHRQSFASLALRLHEIEAVDVQLFAGSILTPLLELAEDKVPNVRLGVARTLLALLTSTEFSGQEAVAPHLEQMRLVENNLKNDVDVDVRECLGGAPKEFGHSGETTFDDDPAEPAHEEDQDDLTDIGASPL